MPTKQQAIGQTRKKTGAKKSKKTQQDAAKKRQDTAVVEHTVTIHNVHYVQNTIDLVNLIQNVITRCSRSSSPVLSMSLSKRTLHYVLSRKTCALSIAKQIQRAFKQLHPEVEISHPKNNEYYTIVVTFQKPT